MPAIQVARTDTFEQQRQKINQIGSSLFNITAGGSDLSTGNLKLGNGSKTIPSLAFVNEPALGLYRPSSKTVSWVSSGKNIFDITETNLTVYKDHILTKRSIPVGGGINVNPGSGYEYGTYLNVPLFGGSGSNGEATIFVDYFDGTVGSGSGYKSGSFTSVPLIGGTGSGATINFSVPGLSGSVTNPGSGYADGSYPNVPLTGGSAGASGAKANIEVLSGVVSNVSIIDEGNNNYVSGDVLSASNTNLGGSGSGFQYTVSSNGGIINFSSITKSAGYSSGDILSLPVGKTVNNVNIPGTVSISSVNLVASDTTVTLPSATNAIIPGMIVATTSGSTGEFPGQTVVTVVSITNSTTIVLSAAPSVSGSANLIFTSTSSTTLTIPGGTSGIYPGYIISGSNYSGLDGVTVSTVPTSSTITLSSAPSSSFYQANLTFNAPWGNGGSNQFEYTVNDTGVVDNLTITNAGVGYDVGDILTTSASNLISPITYNVTIRATQVITFTGTVSASQLSVGDKLKVSGGLDGEGKDVLFIKTSGSNISYIIVGDSSFSTADILVKIGTTTPTFTISTVSTENKFQVNTGSGDFLHPNLTLYSGETYIFSNIAGASHPLRFSTIRDGIHTSFGPFNTTLSTSSDLVTVSSTSGIQSGMRVEETGNDTAQLAPSTVVSEVVDLTTIRLSSLPITSGSIQISVIGSEYTENVTITSTSSKIKVTSTTPSTLYYYCGIHPDMAGENNDEAVITVSQNNPRVFGSGFTATLDSISSDNIITLDIETGTIDCSEVTGDDISFTTGSFTGNLTAPTITSSSLTATSITSSTSLDLTATTSISLSANVNLGTAVTVTRTTGNITTSGVIKSTSQFNSNDILFIQNGEISTFGSNSLRLKPANNQLTIIEGTTALVIPSGTTSERPIALAQNGSIRFNTNTNQYEGYSSVSSSWSSLGGVRDLDGNTYITAESSVGANDNTLWFYNDNNNTIRFTPEYQEFVNIKKIRSVNTSAPINVLWTANTPVTTGQYLKYRNNIYEVVSSGTTGTSGSEPTDTTGNSFTNGTSTLRFFVTAVAPLTFEEITEVRIAPVGGTSLSINSDLRFANNIISTDVNDVIIRPNTGKKVTIDAPTSLVLPVGTTNERGNPIRGSVRFNSTIVQYEGYDGTNWSSLGGVRDVDGNTYIIPELSAGSNENILYFYNNGSNTLRVTENEIQLDTIDTIASPTSNALNLEASLVTFNSLSASIDTSSATRTFISTTKDNLDFGLSSGLTNDPLLRLTDTGDIYYNLGFGTGVYDGLKLFDTDLKQFELADSKLVTTKVTLTRNTVNTGSATIYDPALHASAKVQIIAHNETTGDKEFVEYSVIDKGSDIFYTDFGNVKTGAELISCVFDFNANSNVRVTFTLDNAISSGNVVKVTVISNIIKR